MIHYQEIVVLHRVPDFLYIGGGEFLNQGGGEQACRRLSHQNAVGSRLFEGFGVFHKEIRHFLQYSLYHIRLFVTENHDLRHIQKSSRKGVGANDTGQHRAVGDPLGGFPDSFHTFPGSSGSHLGNFQGIRLLLGFDQGAVHGGNLILTVHNLGSEGLRFHRKIHETQRNSHLRIFFRNLLHTECLQMAVFYQLFYGNSDQSSSRKGKNGHCFFCAGGNQIFFPLFHISFHVSILLFDKDQLFSSGTIMKQRDGGMIGLFFEIL